MTERISVTFVTNVIPPFFRQCVSSSLLPVSYVETAIMTTNWHWRRLFADQVENRTKSLWRVRSKHSLTHLFRWKNDFPWILSRVCERYELYSHIMYSIIQARYTVDRVEKSNCKNHRNLILSTRFRTAKICKNIAWNSWSNLSSFHRILLVARIKSPKGDAKLDRSLEKER